MRTTLTIDDDVASLLDKERRRTGEPLKQTVNRCLRTALTSSRTQPKAKPFKMRPSALQLPDGLNLDKISSLLENLEGNLHR